MLGELDVIKEEWSGRPDLNWGFLGPEASVLSWKFGY
jgi:hypothetical protein